MISCPIRRWRLNKNTNLSLLWSIQRVQRFENVKIWGPQSPLTQNTIAIFPWNHATVALLKKPFICQANHYVVCGLMFSRSVFLLGSLRWNWHRKIHQGQVSKRAISCCFFSIQDIIIESFSLLFCTQTLCGPTVFHASAQKKSKQCFNYKWEFGTRMRTEMNCISKNWNVCHTSRPSVEWNSLIIFSELVNWMDI